jgi:hypothetical protein
MARIIDLADLLVAAINDSGLGITARRGYLPLLKRESSVDSLSCLVIPKSDAATLDSRSTQLADREIFVGLIQKLDPGGGDTFDTAAIDALMCVMQELKDVISFGVLGDDANSYTWIKTEHTTLFDPEHLEQFRQFTSILTVTYRNEEQKADA